MHSLKINHVEVIFPSLLCVLVQMEWKFIHCYGDKPPNEEAVDGDVVSTIEYDTTGQFLAIGDRAGRVSILERRFRCAFFCKLDHSSGVYKGGLNGDNEIEVKKGILVVCLAFGVHLMQPFLCATVCVGDLCGCNMTLLDLT